MYSGTPVLMWNFKGKSPTSKMPKMPKDWTFQTLRVSTFKKI